MNKVNKHSSGATRTLFDLLIFEVRKTYAGSALGVAWAVLEPLAFLGTYVLLFAFILKVPQGENVDGIGYVVFIFSGLLPWTLFSNSVARGTGILRSYAQLVCQINFPVKILPFLVLAQCSIDFAINLVLLVVVAAAAGMLAVSSLIAIPAILNLGLFCVAVVHLVSCYDVIFPDLSRIVPTLLRIGVFVTPVLYPPSAMPVSLRFLAELNPVTYLISPFRYAFTQHANIFVFGLWSDMGIGTAVAVTAAIVAIGHSNFVRRQVVDYL